MKLRKSKTINDKVFTLIDQINNTDYKFITIGNDDYLVIEQVVRGKSIFGRKSMTTNLKMLPLNAFVLRLLVEQAQTKPISEEGKPWGNETEKVFETVNFVELRKTLKELTKKFDKTKYPYRFDLESNTVPALESLLKHNNFYFSDGLGYSRKIWLGKSLDRGHLVLNVCLMQGRGNNEELISMDTFVIGNDTIVKLLNHITKIRPEKEEE